MKRIAVIGAGLSGLVVARELSPDCDVTVFEKSRGLGGRMATRYDSGFEFDHGAQFFTARTTGFKDFLLPLQDAGVVATWCGQFVELNRDEVVSSRYWDERNPHYVGTPRMNAIGRHLAADLRIQRNTTVTRLKNETGGWRLFEGGGEDLGFFDWVVLTMPAAQTAALVPDDLRLREVATDIDMRACMALMLGFAAPSPLPWQAALVHGADISWISVNSSKPGRPTPFTLVVHSTNAYADANLDTESGSVTNHLRTVASELTGLDCKTAAFCQLQRWRYANVDKQQGPAYFMDGDSRLAACGDWFRRGRVEAAFNSGYGLVQALKRSL